MSALPSQTPTDLTEALRESRHDQELSSYRLRMQRSNPLERPSFDSDNQPTFEVQETNYFQTLGDRFAMSNASLELLGPAGYAIKSIPEMISGAVADDTVPGFINDNSTIVVDGQERVPSEVGINDVWRSLPKTTTAALAAYGMDLDTLNLLQINNGEKFAEFYPTFVHSIQAQQSLSAFNDAHPFLAGVAGTQAFAANIILDPVFLIASAVSLGAGGAAQQGAKQTAKGLLRTVIQKSAGGTQGALLEKVAKDATKRTLLSRALVYGGGSAYGGIVAASSDLAAQDQAIRLGLQSPDIELNDTALLIGTAAGGLFSHIAWQKATGGRVLPNLDWIAREKDSAGSLQHVVSLANEAKASEKLGHTANTPIKAESIPDNDFIQTFPQSIYDDAVVRDISRYIGNKIYNPDVDDVDLSDLSAYLQKLPSPEELQANLTSPDGFKVMETEYERLTRDVVNTTDRLNHFRFVNNRKDANKMEKMLARQVKSRDAFIEKNFTIKSTDIGDVVRKKINDVPIETLSDRQQRVDTIIDALKSLETERKGVPARSIMSHFMRFSNKLGSRWILPRQYIKADIASDNHTVSTIGRLTGLIEDSGLDGSEILRNSEGHRIKTAKQRWDEDNKGLVASIQMTEGSLRKSGLDEVEIYENLYRHVILDEPLDPRLTQLLSEQQQYLKGIGKRGIVSRTIKSMHDRFVPVRIAKTFDASIAEPAFVNAFKTKYRNLLAINKPDAPVSYRSLERAGFLKRTDEGFVSRQDPITGEDYFTNLPSKYSDLTEDMQGLYATHLDDSLEADAHEAYARLTGSANRDVFQLDTESPTPIRTVSINPMKSRTLLQEIYMDRAVLDSGMIERSVTKSINGYSKSTGYNVARDEAVSEVFGQPVTYHELLDALKTLSSGNAEAMSALGRFQKLDERAAGRFTVSKDFAVIGAAISNVAATLIGGTLAPTIASSELGGMVLRNMVSKGTLIEHTRILGDAISKVKDKERLRHLGILHLQEANSFRMWPDFSDHLPESVQNNPVVRGTKGMALLSRKIFLEQGMTHLSKALAHGTTFAKLHFNRRRFSKLADGAALLRESPENLEGAARKAGIDRGEFQLLYDNGILDANMLEAADALISVRKDALFSDATMLDALEGIANPITRKNGRELYRRLSHMALVDADTFIATPKAGDMAVTDNAMYNLMISMLSFQASFYNNTLVRVGRTPYWKQAGYFSYLLAAEINNHLFREMVYNEKDFSDVIAEWEEHPVKTMTQIVSRLPVQGPMAIPPKVAYALASGRLGRTLDFGGASPNLVSRLLDSAYTGTKSVITGEPLTETQKNNMQRSTPLANNWYIQLLEELPPLNSE